MKIFLRLALIVTICAIALGCLEYGRYEKENAAAEEAAYVFDFNKADAIYVRLEHRLRRLESAPGFLRRPYAALEFKRAEIAYIRGEYEKLAGKEGALVASEEDPRMLFVRTNALYRIVEKGSSRKSAAARIEKLVQYYEKTLRQDPLNADAAYNYEYLQRNKRELMQRQPPSGQDQNQAQKQQDDSKTEKQGQGQDEKNNQQGAGENSKQGQGQGQGQKNDQGSEQNQGQGQQDGQGDNQEQQSRAEGQMFGKEGTKSEDSAKGAGHLKIFVPKGDEEKTDNKKDSKGGGAGKNKPKKRKG